MEIRQVSGGGGYVPVAVAAQQRQASLVEPVEPPPKGGLPASQQVLSKLTPGDRAAIAGATGYRLSPTGAVTNVGGVPPWSFIMAFAASRTAVAPVEETARVSSGDGMHVDVTV
ncbi:hypothetical protein ACFFX1_15770 [Dactylosporangium sucinum]|uniref:Uncharacterized protein n=1 Tax=Dactylosporangium sucinum TaxID=1424081 RepID=A0A917TVQ2_9ACTN|nr:hypothetical protein [Dactylosporangium sucinum]GGM38133.1 hypothetical protein GCM10007977_044560 [Dactylosporangium sucinum]